MKKQHNDPKQLEALKKIKDILTYAVDIGATDVHLQVGSPPKIRVRSDITSITNFSEPLTHDDLWLFIENCLSPIQQRQFNSGRAIDLNYQGVPNLGTFRLNASLAQGQIVITIRPICTNVPTFETLNLPDVLKSIAETKRGLILVVGATGSGKSSTLAAIVDHINTHHKSHIVTIEDPIEFRFTNKKGLVTQKEIGRDLQNFQSALKAVLRQDPDVIMIGEMRDKETIDTALLAAETGHLVLATLHTHDAKETINRIIATYESDQQTQIRNQLSSILKAVVGQRLIPTKNGKGLIPAVEIMINTERIRDLIAQPSRTQDITSAIEEGHFHYHMQSFDQSLLNLYSQNVISYETAYQNSSRPADFGLRCQGVESLLNQKFQAFDLSPQGEEHYLNRIYTPWKYQRQSSTTQTHLLSQSQIRYQDLRTFVFVLTSMLFLFWLRHVSGSPAETVQSLIDNTHTFFK